MVNMTRQDFAKVWEAKISQQELYNKIDENKEILKQQYPTLNDNELEERAIRNTRLELKKIALTSSVQFRGFVLSEGNVVNIGEIMREKALKLYSENPDKAIREKIVIEQDGIIIPIDNREFFDKERKKPNSGYLKPIQDSKFKTISGICRRNGDKEFKRFDMTLNNTAINIPISLNTPVAWRARDSTQEGENCYKIASNSATVNFSYDKTLESVNIRDEVGKAFGSDAISLSQIKEWNNKNKENRNKILVTEGYIVSLSTQPSEKRNYSFALDDDNIGVSETDIIRCYVKEDIYNQVKLCDKAKVLVFGRPTEITNKDTNQIDILLSASGIYVYPEYITPQPQEIKKENLVADEISDKEFE